VGVFLQVGVEATNLPDGGGAVAFVGPALQRIDKPLAK
jgi:hypothetical protein